MAKESTDAPVWTTIPENTIPNTGVRGFLHPMTIRMNVLRGIAQHQVIVCVNPLNSRLRQTRKPIPEACLEPVGELPSPPILLVIRITYKQLPS
jgi:hypothetical protein